MNTDLRTMLRDTADDHPPFELTADPWQRGRRVRRRRRVAGFGAVAAAALVAVGIAVVGLPDVSVRPAPPAGEVTGEPTLPDRLFDVSPAVADVSDDPLGGPASVVYFGPHIRTGFTSTGTNVPVLVGATSDAVRTVRGYDDHSGLARAALSPDGTRLAISQGWPPGSDDPPTVAVIDMHSGATRTYMAPDVGLGGGIDALTWSVDGASLSAATIVTTERQRDEMGESEEGQVRPLTLDLDSGEWIERQNPAALAFSADGELEVRWDDEYVHLVVAEVDGPAATALAMQNMWGEPDPAFSPTGDRVAVAAVDDPANAFNPPMPFALDVFDSVTGARTSSTSLGDFVRVEILGWGEGGVVAALYGLSRSVVERIDPVDGTRETLITSEGEGYQGIDIPAALIDADVRAAEPPPRRIDWVAWLPYVIGAAALALALWAYRWYRSRQRPPWRSI